MRSIKARRPKSALVALILLMACASSPSFLCVSEADREHYWITGEMTYGTQTLPPLWRPDGGGIIFPAPSNYGGNIYIVASDGSNIQRISKSKRNFYEVDYAPDISPSGDRLVYTTSRFGSSGCGIGRTERDYEIETSDLLGDDRQRLTENEWGDYLPQWMPAGERIAFVGAIDPKDYGTSGILAMDPDGRNVQVLYRLSVPYSEDPEDGRYVEYFLGSRWFAWSPNGDALALLLRANRGLDQPQSEFLEVALPDGSDSRRIFETPYKLPTGVMEQTLRLGEIHGEPAWSPDGRRLAFLYHHFDNPWNAPRTRWNDRVGEGCGNEKPGPYLCIVKADGSGLTGIALRQHDRAWGGASLSWSPDGGRVLLTENRHHRWPIWDNSWLFYGDGSFPEQVNWAYIVSVDVSTGEAKTVAPGVYASWSPDGSRIAVLGRYDDGGYLATVAPDGSDFRVLVRADEDGDLELADD